MDWTWYQRSINNEDETRPAEQLPLFTFTRPQGRIPATDYGTASNLMWHGDYHPVQKIETRAEYL